MTAKGTFEVTAIPQTIHHADDAGRGRMSIEKELRGDLEGTSRGEMLTGMSDVKGSAGYVAIERVTGKLHGRAGSFMLQHSGSMIRGKDERLEILVIPDSGTGELEGIRGRMTIRKVDGQHSYEMEYELAG